MNGIDLVTMIVHIGQSLLPIQALMTGIGYIVGILLVITAIFKLKSVAGAGGQGSQEKIFVPLAYFLGGAALIFLPSVVGALSVSVFGSGNILQYIPYRSNDFYSVMILFVRTAGVIWFIRGCVLLVHASEPGVQEGPKGLTFLIAGILAINFEGTASAFNSILVQLLHLTYKPSS